MRLVGPLTRKNPPSFMAADEHIHVTRRQIEILLASITAEESGDGIYVKAGADKGTDRATVYQTLKRLERVLGVTLVDKSISGTPILTPEARSIGTFAIELLAAFDSFEGHVRTPISEGTVRVGCYPAHVIQIVANAMDRSVGPPYLQLSVIGDESRPHLGAGLLNEVRAGAIDLAIAPRQPFDHDEFRFTELYEWHLVACSPYAENLEGHVNLSKLALEGVVTSPRGHSSRDLLEGASVVSGIPIHVSAESTNVPVLLELGRIRQGIPIVPCDTLRYDAPRSVVIDGNRQVIKGTYGAWTRVTSRSTEYSTYSRLASERLLESSRHLRENHICMLPA